VRWYVSMGERGVQNINKKTNMERKVDKKYTFKNLSDS